MVFFAMRALFALLGAFANRHPIEKWAAFAALMSAQMDEWRAGFAGGGVSTGLLRGKSNFPGPVSGVPRILIPRPMGSGALARRARITDSVTRPSKPQAE